MYEPLTMCSFCTIIWNPETTAMTYQLQIIAEDVVLYILQQSKGVGGGGWAQTSGGGSSMLPPPRSKAKNP